MRCRFGLNWHLESKKSMLIQLLASYLVSRRYTFSITTRAETSLTQRLSANFDFLLNQMRSLFCI